jgi:hypothetical protein
MEPQATVDVKRNKKVLKIELGAAKLLILPMRLDAPWVFRFVQ